MNTTTNPQLSKSDFRSYRRSPRHLWAKRNGRQDPYEGSPLYGIMEDQIQELGREFIEKWLLPQMPGWEFFWQKSLLDGPYLASIVALLVKDGRNAILYEIKISTKVKSEDVADAAFLALIIRKYYQIEQVNLILVDNSYSLQGNLELNKLLKIEDISDRVLKILPELERQREKALQVLSLESPEELEPCWNPDKCICLDVCHPSLPVFSVFDIPKLGQKKKQELLSLGIREAGQIPLSLDLSDGQKKAADIARTGIPQLDLLRLQEELTRISYPVYFLDYETCGLAVPIHEGYIPYQPMVFQYSLHRLDEPFADPVHFEHLSEVGEDPSVSLLTSLKKNIGSKGSIVVWYANFETSRNQEMARLHPQYVDFLENLNSRIFDLMEIVSKGIYRHPGFRGGNSLKDVLPVMVPELSYSGLEINKGEQASYGWWQLACSNLEEEERKIIIAQMLAYCCLDSLAMVEIYRKFIALGRGN